MHFHDFLGYNHPFFFHGFFWGNFADSHDVTREIVGTGGPLGVFCDFRLVSNGEVGKDIGKHTPELGLMVDIYIFRTRQLIVDCLSNVWSQIGLLTAWPLHMSILSIPRHLPFDPEPTLSGWCFGTFFIFQYIGNNHPNWLIFFRGVQTSNQLYLYEAIWHSGW